MVRLHRIRLVLLLWLVANCGVAAQPELVFVAASGSDVKNISILDIRRLYLGMPAAHNTNIQKVLLNRSSASIHREFLKDILHLTEAAYQRKIAKKIFRRGKGYIDSFDHKSDLVEFLLKNKNTISYMNKADAVNNTDLKVVKLIWE